MKKSLKKVVIAVLIMAFVSIGYGCGDTKKIGNNIYDTYGFINSGEKRNENVEYKIIIGNVVWSILLVETIVAPLYFWGFSIYEPVGLKDKSKPKGAI